MKIFRIILAVIFISVSVSAGAAQLTSIAELTEKYDSISCKKCHKEIYEQWEKSHHARPLMGLNDNIMLVYIKASGGLEVKNPADARGMNFPCFKCHLPQAVNAADSLYPEIAAAVLGDNKDALRGLNIGCIVCHNDLAIIHRLEDGKPADDTVYGNKESDKHQKLKVKIYTNVKKSVIMSRSVMCGQCHGLGPNLEFESPVQCASLYGSYLNAYIPDGGSKTCQECHMKQGDHRFMPDYNSKEETSKFLSESISLSVDTLGYEFLSPEKKHIPMVVVNAGITNTAGHRFPDG